jgi:hypothetical protein
VKTGRNIFSGSFVGTLREAVDLSTMIFSPGAKGGTPPDSIISTPADVSISVAFTTPPPPTGWTLDSVIAAAIEDGAPDALPSFATFAAEDDVTQTTVVITGLTPTTDYIVGGWTRWLKPDGSIAYGPSINEAVSTTA